MLRSLLILLPLLALACLVGACMSGSSRTDEEIDRDLDVLVSRIESYRALHDGRVPEALDELARVDPAGELPLDPWGRPYTYRRTGSGCVVGSLGADGFRGGRGADRDRERIARWN